MLVSKGFGGLGAYMLNISRTNQHDNNNNIHDLHNNSNDNNNNTNNNNHKSRVKGLQRRNARWLRKTCCSSISRMSGSQNWWPSGFRV